mgnify:FL=1
MLTRAKNSNGVNLSWTPNADLKSNLKAKANREGYVEGLRFLGFSTPLVIKIIDFDQLREEKAAKRSLKPPEDHTGGINPPFSSCI